MADSTNLVKWHADRKTGGTATDLDGKGQDSTKPIAAGHRCELIENGAVSWWECRSSGATASDDVVVPVADALTAANDENLRWHRVGASASGGTSVSISETHSNFPNGISSTELWRCQLQSGEALTVNRLELQLSGGGTEAAFSLEVVESTDGGSMWTQLAIVTAGGTPVTTAVSSTAAALVAVRVTNASGTGQDACLIASMGIA